MYLYNNSYINPKTFQKSKRTPDFDNLIKVINREKPRRPTLFEFVMNQEIYDALTEHIQYDLNDPLLQHKKMADAFRIAGYDFVAMPGSRFYFETNRPGPAYLKTFSLNDVGVICDRPSYENYKWPDPDSYDYSVLDQIAGYIPDGMKIIACDPYGVLEQVTHLTGYDNLCYMLADDPGLVKELFDQVGSRLVRYHEICAGFKSVAAHFLGDDWGFNSQTMISHGHLRKYVTPWHKKAVETIHAAGKIAILHSCGNLGGMMEDVIEDLRYDAKHSFEDKIVRVEDAYDLYGKRIALLGGIDLDFLCRSTPEEVYNRSASMLEKTGSVGYALGSGNSIPGYVPIGNYLAMNAAAVFQ